MNCIRNEENPIGEMMKVIKTTQVRQIKSALQPIEIPEEFAWEWGRNPKNSNQRNGIWSGMESHSHVGKARIIRKRIIDGDGAILKTERSINTRYIKKGTTLTT